jgi:hypothetical protein
MAKIAVIMRAHGLSLAGKGAPAAREPEAVVSPGEEMVHAMCAAVDGHDFEKFGSYFADTAEYRFGNQDPVLGRAAIVEATANAVGSLPPVRHRVDQVAEVGNQLFCRFLIEVDAPSGTVAMPCVTVIELSRKNTPEIIDYRVHMDISPALHLS